MSTIGEFIKENGSDSLLGCKIKHGGHYYNVDYVVTMLSDGILKHIIMCDYPFVVALNDQDECSDVTKINHFGATLVNSGVNLIE